MKPDDFISDWIEKNPKGCQTLAGAVLYSYFNDSDDDSNQRFLTSFKGTDNLTLASPPAFCNLPP
jgi:hypothetical protein